MFYLSALSAQLKHIELSFRQKFWRLSFPIVTFGSLLMTVSGVHAQSISFADDTGQIITLPQPPQRIVSLAPAITENLFAIGLGDKVVGVSSFSDYPEQTKHLPIVSDYQTIDLEAVAKLKPDIVIAWHGGQSPAQIAALQQLNIPIFYQKINTLTDIPISLMRLSQMARNQTESAPIIAQAYSKIPLLAQAANPPLNAFYQVWANPLMTLNGNHWVSDMLLRCGAGNIFADLAISAPTVNIEDVIAQRPALIITGSKNGVNDGTLDLWHSWTHIPAIQHQGLIYMDADTMNRATLRTLTTGQQLCERIEQVRNDRKVIN